MKTIFWSAALLVGLSVVTLVTLESKPDGVVSTQFTQIDEMLVARAVHQATLLRSGEILITGGCTESCATALSTAELYKPADRVFRPAAAMAIARISHAAIPLTDRRVLVIGGWSERQATNNVEIYEPEEDRYVSAGAMLIPRAAPVAVLLPDGRVLVTGGQTSELEPLASAEVFDPVSSTFSSVASMTVPRIGHLAVSLADGRVLVIGGRQARRSEILNSAEIFDPSTGQFQLSDSMSLPRHKHAAALLPDGRVLVIGGSDARDYRGRYRSTEIYDPETGKFFSGPDMHWPRFKHRDAVATLPSGEILIAGGAPRMERYDPKTNSFVVIPGELKDAMAFATASLLPNGEVLLLGGYDREIQTSSSAWLVRNEH